MSFGSRVKAARQALGMQQRELAERAQITQQSICRYEKGNHEPTLRVAIRLSGVLGVSIDELAQDESAEVRGCETIRETSKCVSCETGRECETDGH